MLYYLVKHILKWPLKCRFTFEQCEKGGGLYLFWPHIGFEMENLFEYQVFVFYVLYKITTAYIYICISTRKQNYKMRSQSILKFFFFNKLKKILHTILHVFFLLNEKKTI